MRHSGSCRRRRQAPSCCREGCLLQCSGNRVRPCMAHMPYHLHLLALPPPAQGQSCAPAHSPDAEGQRGDHAKRRVGGDDLEGRKSHRGATWLHKASARQARTRLRQLAGPETLGLQARRAAAAPRCTRACVDATRAKRWLPLTLSIKRAPRPAPAASQAGAQLLDATLHCTEP